MQGCVLGIARDNAHSPLTESGPSRYACAARCLPALGFGNNDITSKGRDGCRRLTPRSGDVGRVRLRCGAHEGLTVPRLTGYPRCDSPTPVRGLPSPTTRWTPTRRSWSIARYSADCVTSGNAAARRRANVDSPCSSAGFLTFARADLLRQAATHDQCESCGLLPSVDLLQCLMHRLVARYG